jgi:hypothetical protein
MSRLRITIFIFAAWSILFFPHALFAAGFDLITFSTSPSTPAPEDVVTIQMQSYAVNLNSANITWYVDKVPMKNGIAETSFTVKAGNFGEKIVIDVLIVTADGMTINKQYILAPAEVDVLWEAQTYTPPFYKGKALPTYKSMVRLTAIPRFNATSSDPKDYYYKWTYNRIMGAGEALGKNSITIPVGYSGVSIPVSVDVSLPNTDWKGSKYSSIPVFEPSLLLYEVLPLLGVNNAHALSGSGSVTSSSTEVVLRAVPYFFSIDNLTDGSTDYAWSLDRTKTSASDDPLTLTILKSGTQTESHTASLTMRNTKRILQSGKADSMVVFRQEQ